MNATDNPNWTGGFNYYPTATATDGGYSTGDYILTTQEERERKLQDEIDKFRRKYYEVNEYYQDLMYKLSISSHNKEIRENAIKEVVKIVVKTLKMTYEIYEKIIEKVDKEEGSYSISFIAKAIIKERKKEVMNVTTRSKRRLTLKPDKLQQKKSKPILVIP